MKNFLLKFKYLLIGLFLAFAGTAYAINVTVPQSTGLGDILRGNANGTYTPYATGSEGTVLKVVSGVPTWSTDLTGGSGSVANGIAGYVTRYTGTSTITTGILLDNATVAGVNATSSTVSFTVQGSGALNPFNVASSSGNSYLFVQHNGLVGVNSSTPIGTLAVKGQAGSTAPLVIASSTGVILMQVNANGSTTLSSLGTGIVRSTSGSLFNGLVGLTSDVSGVLPLANGGIATTTLGNLTVGSDLSVTGGQLVLVGTSTQISLGSNVVTSVVNDTNVTGSIAANALTLGWTGTLAAGRLNSNVVQAITNDTNVTGSISAQNLTLGWTGVLSVARGGIATTTLGNLTVSSSNLSVTGGQQVLIGTSTVITLTGTPTFTTLSTGQGQYELYAMNQDVLTSSNVTFNTLTVTATTTLSVATTTINGATYYWPSSLPAGNRVLQSDSSGNLSWVTDQTGGGGSVSGGITGYIATWASSTGLTTGIGLDNGTVAGFNATSSTVTLNVQGNGTRSPFDVSSSSGTSYLRVMPNGQVNIGTTTPTDYRLQVQDNNDGNLAQFFRQSGNIVVSLFTRATGVDLNTAYANGSLNSWYVGTLDGSLSGTNLFGISQNGLATGLFVRGTAGTGATGLVSINTTTPTHTFTVVGAPGAINPFVVASSSGSTILQITPQAQILTCTTCRLTIPQGTAPTLSAAGDVAVDTSNGGVFSFYANGRENLVATTTKAFFIQSPTASESHKTVPGYSFDVPVTITKVRCLITSDSNTPSWTFSLPHSTSLGTASANAMTSGQTCTATTTPQTITIGGDLTLAAGEVIWATSSAVSNASSTTIFIDFKYDN